MYVHSSSSLNLSLFPLFRAYNNVYIPDVSSVLKAPSQSRNVLSDRHYESSAHPRRSVRIQSIFVTSTNIFADNNNLLEEGESSTPTQPQCSYFTQVSTPTISDVAGLGSSLEAKKPGAYPLQDDIDSHLKKIESCNYSFRRCIGCNDFFRSAQRSHILH